MKPGRPSKISDAVIASLEEQWKHGATDAYAAEYVGISHSALIVWLRKGREASRGIYRRLIEARRKADEYALHLAQKRIAKELLSDDCDPNFAMKIAARRAPEKWAHKSYRNLTQEIKHLGEMEVTVKLPPLPGEESE